MIMEEILVTQVEGGGPRAKALTAHTPLLLLWLQAHSGEE